MPNVEDVLMVKGPDVVVAGADCTVQQAANMMHQANVGSVIVRNHGAILGIVTERDMVGRVLAKGLDASAAKLGDVMSSPVKTCGLGDSMDLCMERFQRDHIRRLVVVADGMLLGLIRMRDVIGAQLKARNKRIEEIEKALAE